MPEKIEFPEKILELMSRETLLLLEFRHSDSLIDHDPHEGLHRVKQICEPFIKEGKPIYAIVEKDFDFKPYEDLPWRIVFPVAERTFSSYGEIIYPQALINEICELIIQDYKKMKETLTSYF